MSDAKANEPPYKRLPGRRPEIDYPCRTFAVALNALVGWSEERVLVELAHPDSREEGRNWPPLASGSEGRFPLVLMPGGNVMSVHVFGKVQQSIPFPTPYETWTYHNVKGATWLLHFIAAEHAGPNESRRPKPTAKLGCWGSLLCMVREPPAPGPDDELAPPTQLRPSRPIVVGEVQSYPSGAVF